MLDSLQRSVTNPEPVSSCDRIETRRARRGAKIKIFDSAGQEAHSLPDVDSVPVDDIKTLEGGGLRLLRNPKWDEIKDSIRSSGGLSDALPVTIRPGDHQFTCYSGGNTRLLAQQELYRETGDPAFADVRVDIRPFTNDFELVALHHRENACRGDRTFFEEAWAIYRMYKAFCDSQPVRPKARVFLSCIREDYGLSISADSFSRIKYAVETLYQHMPTCLVQGGMSLRGVRRLIALRTALKKVWESRSIGTVAELDEAFYGVLARQDKELAASFAPSDRPSDQFPDPRITIDWEMLRGDLQHEFAVHAEVSYQRSGAWIAAAFRRSDAPSRKAPLSAKASLQGDSGSSSSCGMRPTSAAELRRRACSHAQSIAACTDIEGLVEPVGGGAGFVVTGKPTKASSSATWACWWLLTLSASPGDEIEGYLETMADVKAPSILSLPANALQAASKLLDTQARLAREKNEVNVMREETLVHAALAYLAALGPYSDPRLCSSMGIRRDQMERLQEMNASALLDLATLGAGCVKVEIDAEAFDELIADVDERTRRAALIRDCILHDASRPMMTFFFEMSHRDFTRARNGYGAALTTGRPRELTADEAGAVLDSWQAHGGDYRPETLLAIAKELHLPLRLIWEELSQNYQTDGGELGLI